MSRIFFFVALVTGLAFAFVTPPFQVPDEVTHYWRATSIAYGTIQPDLSARGAVAEVPDAYRQFVYATFRDSRWPNGVRLAKDDFRRAWLVSLDLYPKPVAVTFIASYTPVPYAPQIAAALVGRVFRLRPMATFYLGRVANVLAFAFIVAWVIRMTPYLPRAFFAVALWPMSAYLTASWSADAMTIALAFLVAAMVLRGLRASPFAAFLLGLCKPGYSVISLLGASRRKWLAIVAALAGAAIATLSMASLYAPVSGDARAQWPCVRAHPLRFAAIAANDLAQHGTAYVEQAVGRLGVLDLFLPRAVIGIELALLALIILAGDRVPWRERVMSIVIVILVIAGTELTLYLTWSAVCGNTIEGVQGRYFLPIVPLLAIALARPAARNARRERALAIAVPIVVTACNLVALYVIAARYYGSFGPWIRELR
ncbi:MAG TPA: DUF2142 domain-containing protein [Thermoanaerobaculia bacterium]|nr:DUF2142 domain-containing protein [Thermoanaerobaculia bacterium]